uniref:Uncharacterized protein n=1 Tax=Anguilla anguilla TaxID=7936 RepID=A0A0E9XSW6_ANGAN
MLLQVLLDFRHSTDALVRSKLLSLNTQSIFTAGCVLKQCRHIVPKYSGRVSLGNETYNP